MILLISTCADKLSEAEFVRPVAELVHTNLVKHYSELTESDLTADKIIICGTALKDFEYLNGDWSWLSSFGKPVLGICAGFQVIARHFGEELVDKKLIGVFDHKYFVTSKLIRAKNVNETSSLDGLTTGFKHGLVTAYAFHPEVLNPELISEFCRSQ
jgi:hypothetical protein